MPMFGRRLISIVLCFIEVCWDRKDSSSDVKVCLFGHNKDVELKEDEWLTDKSFGSKKDSYHMFKLSVVFIITSN